MKTPIYLGVEIGGTKLQVALGDGAGLILERVRGTVDSAAGGAGIRAQIAEAVAALGGGRELAGAGVGFGGPVDWRTGAIRCSHQVEGWSGFELGAWLSKLARCPVAVDNDANVAALAEARHGAGVGFNPVFYVTLGSGVGGGLVANGNIYHGDLPGESEIGHVRLDRTGVIVEQRCSGWAVDRRVREEMGRDPEGFMAAMSKGRVGGEARWLKPAVESGDLAATRILEEVAGDLAFALSHVAHLAHPEMIVLGGGLSMLGEPLRSRVAGELERHVMGAFRPRPAIAIAALGEDVVPVGALVLAAEAARA